MAEDTNYVTLEVAIDASLYDNLIHAAANRGQSVSEFVESVLDREVEQALKEAENARRQAEQAASALPERETLQELEKQLTCTSLRDSF